MQNIIKRYLIELARSKVKRRRLGMIVSMLSLAVVMTVFWQLRIVGISMTGEALCGHVDHTHTEECLGMKLVCGLEEAEAHSHTDECYKLEDVQICEKEVHAHSDECQKIRVDLCEDEEHEHGDGCFQTEDVQICQDETEGHEHSDACFEARTTQICGKEVHAHTEGTCYVFNPCTCPKEAHEHVATCFEQQKKLSCGKEETEGHAHTPECEREAYVCGFETEHTHTLLCYSDSKADLETKSDWEKTVPDVTGNPANDLAAVAISQLGYTESQANYKVGEDGTTKYGYTRYGEWYGNPYGNWNGMFICFCMNYSNHPDYDFIKNSGVESMRTAAVGIGKYTAVGEGVVPAAGSIVFFDRDSNGKADFAGIVTYAGNGAISVVAGDVNGAVASADYAMNNGTIMGYALLPARVPMTSTGPSTQESKGSSENVTITFVINNSAYTNDNGTTHVTATSLDGLSTDGGLTYTKWAGRYKVTGTGTLATVTIPAGTSLSANGLATPNVKYDNIGTDYSVGYSALNWVTAGNVICNASTVFTGDTTLYLYLYEEGTTCSLNFVCNCDNGGSHSITYYVSGFGSPTFTWGQGIPASFIPTAEAVNSRYTGSQYCTTGPDYGKVFTGWYLIDSETGAEVPFTAGMPLVEKYKDSNAERTIRVYANWEDAPVVTTVTATFVNGTETTKATLNKGDALGTNLPAAPAAPEGKLFAGWQIGDTAEYATAETVINADTTYTAVFTDKVTVIFKNGETVVATRELAAGTAVGELPTVEAPAGQSFLGWVPEDSADSTDYLTADTVITESKTYIPAFSNDVTVTFKNSEGVPVKTLVLPSGSKVGTLPLAEAPAGQSFAGWIAEDSAEGSTDYLTADTVITQTKAYIPVFINNVTVTFMNGSEQFGNVVTDVPVGAKLWDYLPQTEPEGYTDGEGVEWHFDGWQIAGQEGCVDEETTVPAGLSNDALVLNAVFTEFSGWSVYLHDIDPDGNEYLHEGSTADYIIPDGENLNDWYGGEYLPAGDFAVEQCIWYYKNGNGEKVLYDLNAPVTSELHLYTYSYRMVLMQEAPQAASFFARKVEVSNDGKTITLTLREGEKPTAADFIVDGEDYTLYTWTYDDNGTTKTLNLADVIANGVTENITAVAAGKLTTQNLTITYYAFVNGDRYEVEKRSTPCVRIGSRYCISAAVLEDVYSDFGFTADMLKSGTRYFPHADAGRADIWANASVEQQNGMYYSPVIDGTGAVEVYYVPRQSVPASGGHNYTNYTSSNETFYTVEAKDPAGVVYPAGELNVKDYVLTGNPYTIELDYSESAPWRDNGSELPESVVDIDEENGTATYSFPAVNAPILLTPYRENEIQFTYQIDVSSVDIGAVPNVNGFSEYTDTIQVTDGTSYVVKAPSKLQYSTNGNGALNTRVFAGWYINGSTTNKLDPGDLLDEAALKKLVKENGSVITLKARWTPVTTPNSATFYINMEMKQEGLSSTSSDGSNYVMLFSTQMNIDPMPTLSSDDEDFFGGDVADSAANNAIIRQMGKDGYSLSIPQADGTGTSTMLQFQSFPNDEQMLASIRAQQAVYISQFEASDHYDASKPTDVTAYRADYTVNNNGQRVYAHKIICREIGNEIHYVPVSEITSENFTIHWYGMKYYTANGWHIDGVLVRKPGYITVKKVFYGEQSAIDAIKPDYSITVTDIADNSTAYTLVVDSSKSGTQPTYVDGNTYTWVIPLTAGDRYNLKENNYIYSDGDNDPENDLITTSAEIRMDNPVEGSDQITTREHYDPASGVTVVAKSYNANIDYTGYQTVNFFNSYLSKRALDIFKMDDSGEPVPGVAFKLMLEGQQAPLWKHKQTGVYYISDPKDADNYDSVENGLIVVNDSGHATVMGMHDGTVKNFTLIEETAPEGYIKSADINFKLTANGTMELVGTYDNVSLADGVMRIVNNSARLKIKVTKNWQAEDKPDVTVRLMKKDASGTLSAAGNYPDLVLNESNNWTASWENVPYAVGGTKVEYTIREIWIGDTAYNSQYPDGFENYVISVTAPAYTYDDAGLPTEAAFTVTNTVRTGGLQFTKVDPNGTPLFRAGFQLYRDAACTQTYGYGVFSDLRGIVNFGDLAVGTYYMREERAPAGYIKSDTVYKITVTTAGTTITELNSDKSLTSIVNEPATASLKVQTILKDHPDTPLEGARYEIWRVEGGVRTTKVACVVNNVSTTLFVSGADGFVEMPNLPEGDYELVETGAPIGYYRVSEPIPFTVVLGAISTHDVDDNNGWYVQTETNSNGQVVDLYIVVENTFGTELPQTGGMGTLPVTTAGLLMMAASLTVILLRRKRERRND
ncbi:MAG: LPXTG cell wall anchor domain-containing protein [Oscillospiraceae bacterium]|nr:LPXTG cell wall anchor domain-containing protein [Oscillospiraceae bacterium]